MCDIPLSKLLLRSQGLLAGNDDIWPSSRYICLAVVVRGSARSVAAGREQQSPADRSEIDVADTFSPPSGCAAQQGSLGDVTFPASDRLDYSA